MGAKLLAEGMSIRATARILNVDNGPSNGHLDTVCDKWPSEGPWVSQLGRHCADMAAYHFRNLHMTECQLDELWTFVYKKEDELTPVEHLQGVYGPAPKTGRAASKGHFGDAWVWKVAVAPRRATFRGAIAFAPVRNTPSRGCKIVPVWVAGKRTLKDGKKFVKCLKNRLDEHIPFFTSDDLPHYANALLDVYGRIIEPPRTGKPPSKGDLPGRPRHAYKVPPESGPLRPRGPFEGLGHDLLYAVVCKRREGSRVVEVTTPRKVASTQVVYGRWPFEAARPVLGAGPSPEQIARALHQSPISNTISTYGVERNNLTISGRSRPRGPF